MTVNKDGVEYVESGHLQLDGQNFTIIKLKNVQYVAGFLTHYIVVPNKSLPSKLEPNPE